MAGMKRVSLLALLVSASMFAAGMTLISGQTTAQESVDDLRAKIQASEKQLQAIEAEIRQFEKQLNEVGAEKQTLNKAIRELELARSKVQSEVRATEQKINSTDLEISELDREIKIKQLEIDRNTAVVGQSFRTIDLIENDSLVEMLLSHNSLADVWDTIESHTLLQESLRADIRALLALKTEYERALGRSVSKRGELSQLHQTLSGEQQAVEQTKKQKDSLLSQTANKEANYQKLLAEKKAARQQFEKEMRSYEAQLSFILDKSTIPAVGSGVLAWPFEAGYMLGCPGFSGALGNPNCITQYFGNTAFAQSGAYNGNGHNGIDFRAPVGTKVLAALTGTVSGTGDTDAVSGCYSYGKWVLIKHANGLSTLYAHLSSIAVSPGQAVSTGQLIGHSGNTGYSTGPHLHFTVYATQGVKVQRLGDIPGRPITGCSPAAIPVAGFEAYLNPLNYL